MIGLGIDSGNVCGRRSCSSAAALERSPSPIACSCCMSAPAQKPRPAPVTTITRTSSSFAHCSSIAKYDVLHLRRPRVQAVGTVERQQRHAVLDLHLHYFALVRSLARDPRRSRLARTSPTGSGPRRWRVASCACERRPRRRAAGRVHRHAPAWQPAGGVHRRRPSARRAHAAACARDEPVGVGVHGGPRARRRRARADLHAGGGAGVRGAPGARRRGCSSASRSGARS